MNKNKSNIKNTFKLIFRNRNSQKNTSGGYPTTAPTQKAGFSLHMNLEK